MKGSYLGPEYNNEDIKSEISNLGAVFEELTDSEIINKTAFEISEGKAIGWFQGRMEFGPRALGCRSIIADSRSKEMQKNLNLKVKFRESFRPFAPSILREDVDQWFDFSEDSPYMLLVADVKKNLRYELNESDKNLFGIDKLNTIRSTIPAVTHIDYSARIQTVHKDTNSKYYALISEFKKLTGCPIIVNTSFNVRGEPIVCTATDAFKCFMGTNLDCLVIGNYFLAKEKQNKELLISYEDKYDLD